MKLSIFISSLILFTAHSAPVKLTAQNQQPNQQPLYQRQHYKLNQPKQQNRHQHNNTSSLHLDQESNQVLFLLGGTMTPSEVIKTTVQKCLSLAKESRLLQHHVHVIPSTMFYKLDISITPLLPSTDKSSEAHLILQQGDLDVHLGSYVRSGAFKECLRGAGFPVVGQDSLDRLVALSVIGTDLVVGLFVIITALVTLSMKANKQKRWHGSHNSGDSSPGTIGTDCDKIVLLVNSKNVEAK